MLEKNLFIKFLCKNMKNLKLNDVKHAHTIYHHCVIKSHLVNVYVCIHTLIKTIIPSPYVLASSIF